MKTEVVFARITPDLKAALEKRAKSESRTVSSLIGMILTAAIQLKVKVTK